MELSPDAATLATLDLGGAALRLNLTIATTWAVMALLVAVALIATRPLRAPGPDNRSPTTARLALEVVLELMAAQITEISRRRPGRFLPFVGTLFLFIAVSNLLLVIPGFTPPTASLSTTAALAIAVLVAIPIFAVAERGLGGYLRTYVQPTPLMLPFNLIGEFSRVLALAIRLYGNVMSGTVIAAILLSVAPLFLPVLMDALGLLTGMIQAYIFAILAMVYIAAAVGPEDAGAGPDPAERESPK